MRLDNKSDRNALFCRGFIAAVLVFLFLYATEIILTYVLGGKLRPEKILFYAFVYVLIGAAFGAGFSAIRMVTRLVKAKFTETDSGSLNTSLFLSGFVWFYTFVVLNGYYLSNSSLFSSKSILLDCVLTIFCIPAFLFPYFFHKKGTESEGMVGAVNTTLTAAILVTVLHAFVSRTFGGLERGAFLTAGITAAYALTGTIAVLADHAIAALFRAMGKATRKIWTVSAVMKILVVSICLGTVLYLKHSAGTIQRKHEAYASPMSKGTPNIVLIVLDTVRQDHLSVYGCKRETTPDIDRFADKGYVFDAYSTANWTWPSHATIMTGLYSIENGTSSSLLLDGRNDTLAELLGRSGYATAAFVSNFGWLSPESGFSQGFDCYFAECAETALSFPYLATHLLLKFYPEANALNCDPCLRGSTINKKAVEWLRKNCEKPFFIFLNYMDAHAPYNPPPPYDKLWLQGPPRKELFKPDMVSYLKYEGEVSTGKRQVSNSEREFLIDQYDRAIRSLDDRVAEFLSALKELGLYEKSLIVITSDHGEGFGEHGIVQHTGSLYQEMIHVPLIIKPPARSSVKPSNGPVSLVYLFHSILNFLNIPHTTGKQDRDIFNGETMPILSEFHLDAKAEQLLAARYGKNTYCLIIENLKLIKSSNGDEEVFDIATDPSESKNLLARRAGEKEHERLKAIESDLDKNITELNSNVLIPAKPDADTLSTMRQKLKSLGYLQ